MEFEVIWIGITMSLPGATRSTPALEATPPPYTEVLVPSYQAVDSGPLEENEATVE